MTTLDGVVTLNEPGYLSGGSISGFDAHDHLVMGLLWAVADAGVVGAGTLRSVPRHLWTAAYIYPALAESYQALRAHLGQIHPPLNVIVTARGDLDLHLPIFQSGEVPVLIVTTTVGKQYLQ
jgi:riboflavin biosynthesis pyrimidine reductase